MQIYTTSYHTDRICCEYRMFSMIFANEAYLTFSSDQLTKRTLRCVDRLRYVLRSRLSNSQLLRRCHTVMCLLFSVNPALNAASEGSSISDSMENEAGTSHLEIFFLETFVADGYR